MGVRMVELVEFCGRVEVGVVMGGFRFWEKGTAWMSGITVAFGGGKV